MNDLEKAILDIIEKRYKRKYVGGLKVVQLKNGGYKLSLYLGNDDVKRLEIAGDMDADTFLKYIDKEIVSRLLILVLWFTGIKTYPEDEERRTC